MSSALTPTLIEKAEDRTLERVEIPEWGGHAYIREMDDEERDIFEMWVHSQRQAGEFTKGMRRRLVMLCLVNEQGERIFDDKTGEAVLRKKNNRVMNRLFDRIAEKNGIGDQAVTEEKKLLSDDPSSASATA